MSRLLQLLQSGPTPRDLSLLGQPGPIFETLSDRTNSRIQALTSGANLDASEDLLTGRTFNTRGLSGPYLRPASEPPVSFPNGKVGKPYYRVLNITGGFSSPYPNTNTYLGG